MPVPIQIVASGRRSGIMVIVRYFTRGLVDGELDEEQAAQATTAYALRLDTISPRLPPAVRALADLNLHDGCIESVRWEPARKLLQLSVVVSRPAGYEAAALRYGGALLGEQRVRTLYDVARDRETQILATEVDRDDDDGTFSHRLLFWPRDELTIDFTELSFEVASRPDGRIHLLPYFLEIDPPDLE